VEDFLSERWFEDLNARLATSSPLPEGARACQVVLEVSDAPGTLPHAVTLWVGDGARVTPGDTLSADTIVRVAYADAVALTRGELDSATALREGRIKVRGDVTILVPLAGWLHATLFA
jgi:hypothetical protein